MKKRQYFKRMAKNFPEMWKTLHLKIRKPSKEKRASNKRKRKKPTKSLTRQHRRKSSHGETEEPQIQRSGEQQKGKSRLPTKEKQGTNN